MAHGLEVRPPLLDNEMIDWAFSLPSSLKLHRGTTKYLLKRAARGHCPIASSTDRRRGSGSRCVRGCEGPCATAWRAPSSHRRCGTPVLDRDAFGTWARMHAERRGDHSKALWALIVLDEWVRREKIAS